MKECGCRPYTLCTYYAKYYYIYLKYIIKEFFLLPTLLVCIKYKIRINYFISFSFLEVVLKFIISYYILLMDANLKRKKKR